MSDRPHRDAKAIFLQAIENHTPDQWGAYLDEACGTDESLRGLVEALLRAHQEKDDVFDSGTMDLRDGLSGLSRISLPDAPGDDSPVAISAARGSGGDPPERVGRYRIEGEIARGGVGAVYKAHDDDLGRSLAVKMLLDDHRYNPGMLQRFMEEAQISGQLQHPGIVPVHDVGLFTSEKPYFAMKLIKGQTLAQVLDARKFPAQDRQRFLGIFEHVCETIAYAHARGVIHRDLKPSNVMIGSFGEVQVVDWGLAKVLARGGIADDGKAESEADQTAIATVRSGSTASDSLAGSVLGTPAYMSPEQARGDIDELDERSDVFGLGAILCEVLTGKPPYVASTAKALLNQAKEGYLDDAYARIDACGAHREVTELAKSCLAFEPRERPPNAGSVATAVRDYLESLEERARSIKIEAAKARMRMTVALTVVTGLALAAGGMIWLRQERREREAQLAQEQRRSREQAVAAVTSAVSEARILRATSSAGDPTDHATWSYALDTIRRAERLLTKQVDEKTRQDVADEKSAIEEGHAKSRMRSRLDNLRDIPLEIGDSKSLHALDSGYKLAFEEFLGADVETTKLDDAVNLVRTNAMRAELLIALREWIQVRYLVSLEQEGGWWERAREMPKTRLVQVEMRANASPARKQLRRYERSVAHLKVDDPLFIDLMNALETARLVVFAQAVSMRSDFAAADFCLRTALRREPGNYRVHYALSRLRRRQGKWDEALHHALTARSLRPDRPRPWSSLGLVLEMTGDYDRALEAYARAAVLDPNEAAFYRPLIEFVERLDAFSVGEAVLERTVSDLTGLVAAEQTVGFEVRNTLDLLLYGTIDAALNAPELLIEEGAVWRFFAGNERPSPGLEWAAPEFDDSGWFQGESGFGFGDGDDATVLSDMRGNYASVYIRGELNVPEPERFRRLELSLRVDDGCVIYLNGELFGRVRVSADGAVVGSARKPLVETVFDIPLEALIARRNLIAIEGLNNSLTSSDFSLIPVVRGELAPGAARERDRDRLEEFRRRASCRSARGVLRGQGAPALGTARAGEDEARPGA